MNQMLQVGNAGLSLELPKSQTFDEWVETGRSLSSANKVLQWWIGDWWAAGSHRYGERAKVAAEGIFGRDYHTLVVYGAVSRSFELVRRRTNLSFTHHAEVASLEPAQADELLDRAEQDSWTVRDIRSEASALRSHGGPHRDTSPDAIQWSAIRGAWKRASTAVQERFRAWLDSGEDEDG